MPERRRATLLEDLPEEIFDKILIRLSSKDIGRCRAVSTSWRSATSTPEFMLEHHRRQPSLPIIDRNMLATSLAVFCDAGTSQQLRTFVRDSRIHSNEFIRSACDGFLIVSQGHRFCICNPVIGEHVLLPLADGLQNHNYVVGFYRHHPTGEYRVLWVPWSPSKVSLYVLTVGSKEPRQITVTMPTVLSPSEEHKLLNQLRSWSYHVPPVHHCGSLHWCPYGATNILGGSKDIIVFDTEAESFRCMRSPAQSYANRKLFYMEGTLALWGSSTRIFTTMEVWVMQDYEAEIWAFKYRIDLSTVEASRQLYLTSSRKKRKKKTPLDSTVQYFSDMVVLNERELLIKFNAGHVLRCDIDGKFLGMVNLRKNQYCMEFTPYRLQENITPIPSHEKQREADEPPLPTGHV